MNDKLNDITDSSTANNYILQNFKRESVDIRLNNPLFFDGIIFIFCLKGSGGIRFNYRNISIKENCVITILPKQIVEVIDKSDDCLLEILFVSLSFLEILPYNNYDLFYKIAKFPCIETDGENMFDIMELHSLVVKYNLEDNDFHQRQMIAGLLYATVAKVTSVYFKNPDKVPDKKQSRKEELTENFFTLLLNNTENERSVSYYADKLFLTPKYLSGTIKNVTGKSIQYWINENVLLKSKNLLRTTTDSILEISEKMNFPTPSSFIHFFRKHVGVTPLKYREGNVL
jgi:AraC-like DNA-binding protein